MKAYKNLVLLCATVLCLANAVSAQRPQPRDPKRPTEKLPLDRVAVQSNSINPRDITSGQATTANATIRNLTGETIARIPWRIIRDGETLASGVKEAVAANSSFEISARWTASPGSHTFVFIADPDNTLAEPIVQRANNSRELTVSVQHKIVTQLLDWEKVKRAGGTHPGFGAV